MGGELSIACLSDQTCSFKTTILLSLFGSSGLGLSNCRSGECVSPATINTLSALLAPTTSAGSAPLSSGVIAGMVVLAMFVVGILAMLTIGFLSKRKARRRVVDLTEKTDRNDSIGVRWRNLGYSLPLKRNSTGRVLLNGLSGEASAGQLLAVLGTTGAGKSTFVELLAGKRKIGKMTGSIDLISSNHQIENSKVIIGFVDQEDIFSATSTVREALLFAADLKLSENISIEFKR
jgi:ABC-type transport system involved in cytochrome bd biosynthesis fused ATPase/permease subunit